MADNFQYIKLPDGSYGKFLANASDEQIRSAIQKDFPKAFKAEPDMVQHQGEAKADLEYAMQDPAKRSMMSRRKETPTATPSLPMTTPGQVLHEENRPIQTGFSTMGSEALAGGGNVIGGDSLLQRIMGLAQIANAPSVGAGSAVGTTIQNILANTIPAGPDLPIIGQLGGAGGAIPAGAAAIGDAITQLGTGGLMAKPLSLAKGALELTSPTVMKGAEKFAKGSSQVLPRIFAPGMLREAGAEAIAGKLGAPMQAIERVFTTPASKAAYRLAEAQGSLPTQPLANIVEQAFISHADMANPNNAALRYLSKLEEKFSGKQYGQLPQNAKLPYGEVMKEVQALKAQADNAFNGANPNNILGKTLMDTREHIINVLDQISPTYRQANRLYRQESATLDIMNAIRAGTPGANLEKLITNHPDVARSFSPEVIRDVNYIAKQLSDVASATPAGGFRQALQAIAKPVADMMFGNPLGRALLRNSLQAPKDQLPRTLAAAVQTYKAMTPREQPSE